jgi:carboxymethylenebutenolidase
MSAETPLSVQAPANDRRGGVLVIQEAFGVNEHIEDVCRRLADAGWLAVAPHLFHRTGDPKLGYDDFTQVAPHMQALTPETIGEDLAAAFDHFANAGVGLSHTGVVGFCMGGTLALYTATQREVGAAVTFYGGGVAAGRFGLPSLIELAPKLKAPWLGLYGDLDKGIPVEDVEQLRVAAAASGQETELVRYPDAEHGFNCDVRSSYHAPSAADAWQRMLAWFDDHLGLES